MPKPATFPPRSSGYGLQRGHLPTIRTRLSSGALWVCQTPGRVLARGRHYSPVADGLGRSDEAPSPRVEKGDSVAASNGKGVGLSLGGALVIAGILIWIFWSFWFGLVVALVGLIAFGGFVRGRWY